MLFRALRVQGLQVIESLQGTVQKVVEKANSISYGIHAQIVEKSDPKIIENPSKIPARRNSSDRSGVADRCSRALKLLGSQPLRRSTFASDTIDKFFRFLCEFV